MGAAVGVVARREAESQAYLPSEGQGFVLPAGPRLQMASDDAGHLFTADQHSGRSYQLKATDRGGWAPVEVARIVPSEPQVALGRPVSAWRVLDLDRPVGPPWEPDTATAADPATRPLSPVSRPDVDRLRRHLDRHRRELPHCPRRLRCRRVSEGGLWWTRAPCAKRCPGRSGQTQGGTFSRRG